MNKSPEAFLQAKSLGKNHTAQAVLIDLAFAVFIFILLFAFLYSQWQQNLSAAFQEQEFERLNARATQAVDSLVSSKGFPTDWHLLAVSDINSLGLAKKKRVIDGQKLSRFLSLDYSTIRLKLRLEEFDFHFRLWNSQGSDFNQGLTPDASDNVISLRRIVDYNGVESIVDFEVFKKP